MDKVVLDEIKTKIVSCLKNLKVFRGTFEEQKEKYQALHNKIPTTCTLELDQVIEGHSPGSTGSSHYNPLDNKIVLVGHLSLITYLHELSHAFGEKDEKKAQRFAIDIFSKAYPKSFARLEVATGTEQLLVKT